MTKPSTAHNPKRPRGSDSEDESKLTQPKQRYNTAGPRLDPEKLLREVKTVSCKYTKAERSLNLLTELKRLNLNTRDVEAFMDTLNKKRFTKGKAKTGEKIKLIAIKYKIADARNRLDRTLRMLARKKKE